MTKFIQVTGDRVVNADHVVRLEYTSEAAIVVMSDGERIVTARSGADELVAANYTFLPNSQNFRGVTFWEDEEGKRHYEVVPIVGWRLWHLITTRVEPLGVGSSHNQISALMMEDGSIIGLNGGLYPDLDIAVEHRT